MISKITNVPLYLISLLIIITNNILCYFTVGQDESQEKMEMIKTNLDKGKPVVKSRFYGE